MTNSLFNTLTLINSRSMEDYIAEVRCLPRLKAGEESALAEKAFSGDEKAQNELVLANLRIVLSCYKGFLGNGMDAEDLIQYGNLGLIKAAQRFNPAFGKPFIAFAVPYVNGAILDSLNSEGKMIHVPKYKYDEMRQAYREMQEFGWEDDNPLNAFRTVSISDSFSNDEDSLTYEDVIASDDDTMATDYLLAQSEKRSLVEMLLHKTGLKERQQKALEMFYGINRPAMTAAQIADEMHLTKARIHQLIRSAIEQTRGNAPAYAYACVA